MAMKVMTMMKVTMMVTVMMAMMVTMVMKAVMTMVAAVLTIMTTTLTTTIPHPHCLWQPLTGHPSPPGLGPSPLFSWVTAHPLI